MGVVLDYVLIILGNGNKMKLGTVKNAELVFFFFSLPLWLKSSVKRQISQGTLTK